MTASAGVTTDPDVAASVPLGAGRVCTKTGLVLLPRTAEGARIEADLARHIAAAPAVTLLDDHVHDSFIAGRGALEAADGVRVLATGGTAAGAATPALYGVVGAPVPDVALKELPSYCHASCGTDDSGARRPVETGEEDMTAIDNDVTGVLSKAFDVLDTFGPTRQALSLSDISRRSGLPKTTTHRILQQMLSVGAVDRIGQRYQVGTRVFAASARSREAVVRDVALPHLTELNRRYGHTLHLATLCGVDVLYVEKLHSRATAASPSSVGGRLPAHCTAAGKVLMAWGAPGAVDALRERDLASRTTASITSVEQLRRSLLVVRERGFARDDEEAAVGLRCLAVPVRVVGQPVAAISIAHSSDVVLPKDRLFALQETAARVGRDLSRIPGHLDMLALDGLAG